MKRVDAFLTRKAQAPWPSAVVYRDTVTGRFFLERTDADLVELGTRFFDAREALYQLVAADRARRGTGGDR